MEKNRKNYILLYIFSYAGMGAIAPLIAQYFDYIGFTGSQIGTITAVATLVSMLATGFWGSIYNESKRKDSILVTICLFAGIAIFLLSGFDKYALVLLGYAAFYFFYQPIAPLSDSMTVADGQPFGNIRMWGAIGYAASVYVAGEFSERLGLGIILYLAAGYFVISAIVVGFIHRGRKRALKDGATGFEGLQSSKDLDADKIEGQVPRTGIEKFKKLLHNKRYIQFLFCIVFVGGINVGINTYFGFLYTEAGGTIAGVGLTFLLMAGSEAPFMAWSAKLSAKFTLEKTILFALILSAARLLWYATVPSYTLLTALFFLQGIVNGIILVEFVKYAAKLVDKDSLSFSISLYYIINTGISGIIFQFIGGIILEYIGVGAVFLFVGIFNIIGIILYVAFGLHKEIVEIPSDEPNETKKYK